MKLPIPFPINGQSAFFSNDAQPVTTTREFKNMRAIDPVSGRARGGQRSGLTNYLDSQVDATNPIARLQPITFESRKVTYSQASAPTVNWSTVAPSKKDAKAVKVNFKGDRYVIHGDTKLVKYNRDGQEIYRMTIPVADKDHTCRALAVDDLDNFYIGVSAQGDQEKAKLWKYRHDPDGSVQQDWVVDLGVYVEDMVVNNTTGYLYTAQNDTKNWASRIVVYDSIQTAAPRIAWQNKTGYPVNAINVNKIGEIIAVHEPNANRGLDPNDLNLSPKTVDWTWDNLQGIGDRKHAHFDARVKESIQKDLSNGSTIQILDSVADDGDQIAYWRDLTGYNRDFWNKDAPNSTKKPTYSTKGFLGAPSIKFDASLSQYFSSARSTHTNESTKDTDKQVIPGWRYTSTKGCGFLVWMVVKPSIEATKMVMLSQEHDGTADEYKWIYANVEPDVNADEVVTAGKIWARVATRTGTDPGFTKNFTPAFSCDNVNGAAIIVLICDGFNDGTQKCRLNVNGSYSNAFDLPSASANFQTKPTILGAYYDDAAAAFGNFASFEISAMGVMRSSTKTVVGTTTEVIEDDGVVTTDTELNKLVGWLHHDWGLQHLLPSNHRYKTYPPSASTNTSYPSVIGLLNNQNAFMAKWDASGQLLWAYPSLLNQGVGTGAQTGCGIGYGVTSTENGYIVTTGPKFTGAVNTNEKSIIQMFQDNGASVSPFTFHAIDTFADFSNHYMRLDSDKFNNVYIPMSLTGGAGTLAATVQVYQTNLTMDLIYTYSTTGVYGTNSIGYAVAADPQVPVYSPDAVTVAPGFTVVTTNNSTVATKTIYDVSQITVTFTTGTPRSTHNIAVASGNIVKFDGTSFATVTGGSAVLDSTSEYISSVVAYGKMYFTDGKSYVYYDPITQAVSSWVSTTSGSIPKRCRLMALWRGRIVLARDPDDAHNWHMSRLGDPNDWDKSPPAPDSTQATDGGLSATGMPPSIITALIPYNDDLLLIGCERGVYRMTGDPLAGGQIDLITDISGVAFGRSWAKDEQGTVYFFGSSGGVFMLRPNGAVDRLSQAGKRRASDIDELLFNVDLETYRIEMIWNYQDSALHIYLVPWTQGIGQNASHFVWERKTGSWCIDTFGSDDLQPTAVMMTEDPDPNSRLMLMASGGYIRRWDKEASDDVGIPIESSVLIGPLAPKSMDREVRYTGLEVNLAKEQDGCSYELSVSDGPDSPDLVVDSGKLKSGRNPVKRDGGRGARAWLRLYNGDINSRWAFESAMIDAQPAGRRRER